MSEKFTISKAALTDTTVTGPSATLHLPIEEKTQAHLVQFAQWEARTIAEGKPLNGIPTPENGHTRLVVPPAAPQEIVLFSNCDERTAEHLRNHAAWEEATIRAGKPLTGVQTAANITLKD